MSTLQLRNNRSDAAVHVFAATAVALLALTALIGLIIAQVRDPAGRWLGKEVVAPMVVYLVLETLAFLFFAAMFALAWYKAKKMRDRSIQVEIDRDGIRDLRVEGRDFAWQDVRDLQAQMLMQNGMPIGAALKLRLHDGSTEGIDILGMDAEPDEIVDVATRFWRKRKRQRDEA